MPERLALEYALRHPERVSRLILMNPAPASAHDVALIRNYYLARLGSTMEQQREIAGGAALPEAKLVMLKKCGHLSSLECPQDLRRALREFLP